MIGSIQLVHRWNLGAEIGKGGFGRVFEALGEDGSRAAAKFIPKEPGADRELLFEDLAGVEHVVPIVDSGEWDSHWILVMPRADTSLRSYLSARGALPIDEAATILCALASALGALRGKVVHRDIKPENVLLLNGRWCLSDFGIARYAEASTAIDTHKWAWSVPYNPPERWRGERATSASDVYSLGILAYELVAGRRPFLGPDFREQHLTSDYPEIANCPPALAGVIAECLFKAPEARPTPLTLLERLKRLGGPSSSAASQLQIANHAHIAQRSSESSAQSAARSASERRRELLGSATQGLTVVSDRLQAAIGQNAPAATWSLSRSGTGIGFAVALSSATLRLESVGEVRPSEWGNTRSPFDVIAHSVIGIRIPRDGFGYEGRSHSLWFCDAREPGVFRWYETAFMLSPLIGKRTLQEPMAFSPGEDAAAALGAGLSRVQVAWPFTPLDPGNEIDFIDRWMTWFAQASRGLLTHPASMPERMPDGSWRR